MTEIQQQNLVYVEESLERWSEVKLSDGTTLLIKFSITSALRTDGQYDQMGHPTYSVSGQVQAIAKYSPPHLMKKPDTKGAN